MQRLQAFKYEILPNGEQQRRMRRCARIVAVPPHYTSLTCPRCDYVAAQNRTSQAKFKCLQCGYANHADVVGALNVLARGYRVIACGEEGAGCGQKTPTKPSSVNQEPTEATMSEVDHA